MVCGEEELVEQIFRYREINGASLHPMVAYLHIRGLKTLALRIDRQFKNALTIARWLKEQPFVSDVYYPGLESHPGHKIAREQMNGYGGVLSFFPKGDFDSVRSFLPELKYAHIAANLGPVETVAGPPRTTSHVEVNPEQRKALGIPESLIRYSVGIESVDDLIASLDQALKKTARNLEK